MSVCKLPKTTQQLYNTVLVQSSRRSSHAHAKSPEALISLSIDVGHCFFESCKIIHLRQNSCLAKIACLYFTGLGGAVAEQIDKRELPSIHFALFQAT